MSTINSLFISAYSVAKDFAAPLATAVAAAAATFITWKIQKQNVQIARDRLRLDLFDRRYEIFRASKRIIEIYITHGLKADNPRKEEAKELLKKVGEARFRCGPTVRTFCKRLEDWHHDQELVIFMLSVPSDTSKIGSPGELISQSHSRLLGLSTEVDKAFEGDLQIQRPY